MVDLNIDMMTPEIATAFWSMVDRLAPEECWPWLGCLNGWGYGTMTVGAWGGPATHVSLTLAGELKPFSDAKACHTCDHPICVNPNHLWWGTQKENMEDASRKGRMRGARAWKITEGDVAKIRASSDPIFSLAHEYRISVGYIRRLRNGLGPARFCTAIKRPRESKTSL